MADEKELWAEAYLEKGIIVIRVPMHVLQDSMEQNPRDDSYSATKVTDLEGFAKDVVNALNYEAEDGTTPIHELFDAAIAKAIDDGSLHVDYSEPDRT